MEKFVLQLNFESAFTSKNGKLQNILKFGKTFAEIGPWQILESFMQKDWPMA